MSKTTTVTLNAPNPNKQSSFYLWGFSSADADATISITDPNGNVWNTTLSGLQDGEAFNLPNPAGDNGNPYGWNMGAAATLSFDVTISSTAAGQNEGITQLPVKSDKYTSLGTVLYNDPGQSDTDYNDVVLCIALFAGAPQ